MILRWHISLAPSPIAFVLAWSAASLLLLFPTLAAAQASEARASANLILGTVASDRGTTATIPLYYQPAEDTPIRSLRLEVDFVSNSVKFAKAEKGIAAEVQDFDLAVVTEELPANDQELSRTRLKIEVAVVDEDPGKALPQGLWSFLEFRIPDDAKPFAISLNPASVSAQDEAGQPVEVTVEAGKVIVSVPDEPLVGCFFFTH